MLDYISSCQTTGRMQIRLNPLHFSMIIRCIFRSICSKSYFPESAGTGPSWSRPHMAAFYNSNNFVFIVVLKPQHCEDEHKRWQAEHVPHKLRYVIQFTRMSMWPAGCRHGLYRHEREGATITDRQTTKAYIFLHMRVFNNLCKCFVIAIISHYTPE